MSNISTELGFVEKRAPWKLRSKFFPSKVGGAPAWLRLDNLPTSTDIFCKLCNKPMVFLLQVYAPVIDAEESFHRTVYLFMCRNGTCNKKSNNVNFSVFRNQLPRQNMFYSCEPPEYNEKLSCQPSADQYQPMCAICGCSASINCEKCSEVHYCCEDHRSLDWEWNHVNTCVIENKGKVADKRKIINHFLLPEFELVTETEEVPINVPEKNDEEKMKDYMHFMASSNMSKEFQDVQVGDLDSVEEKKDKAFNKFRKRIELEPEQVLRYQKGGVPLWVSSEKIPSDNDIPCCPCGAKRQFEFQVMPQLLNFLSLDSMHESIDWGTLILYTCSASCSIGSESYAKEFIWKQDFSDISLSKEQ